MNSYQPLDSCLKHGKERSIIFPCLVMSVFSCIVQRRLPHLVETTEDVDVRSVADEDAGDGQAAVVARLVESGVA